jgi:hypothetical protein
MPLSTKAKIRARIAAVLREQIDHHTMQADFADGPERDEHLASVAFFQRMLARGEAIAAAETRH